MGSPRTADPVKLFVAALWADAGALGQALREMAAHWGRIDFQGTDRAFSITHYYDAEMGSGLNRRLVSFLDLVLPESLVEAKLTCNEIEARHLAPSGRQVNLDVGYLDHSKIVLGSVKPAGQKIHLGRGVYADLVGRYRDGKYQPFEWTFPDFRDGRYDEDLRVIRNRYLEQMRQLRRSAETADRL